MHTLPLVVLLGAYGFACLCFGAVLLRAIGSGCDREAAIPSRMATAFLLGQGVLAQVWLLLGLASWFTPVVIAIFLGAVVVAGAGTALRLGAEAVRGLRGAAADLRSEAWPWRLLIAVPVLHCLVLGLCSFVLPLQPLGDPAAFYMAIAKATADSQRLVPLAGCESFSQVGLLGEVHFAALMSLGMGTAAKSFTWFISLAAAALLLSLAGKCGLSRRGQWLSLVVLFTSSTYTEYVWDGKVDLFGMALGLAAYDWALQARAPQSTGAIRLTGLFMAFACISKFPLLVALVPGIGVLCVWQWYGSASARTVPILRALCCLGVWSMAAATPHLVKNWLLFGEPLVPFVSFLGSRPWLEQSWVTPELTRRILWTYPLALVYGKYPMQGGVLSPLALAFAPLAMLPPWGRGLSSRPLFRLCVIAALGVALWAVARPAVLAPRYILPPLGVFMLLAARGAERLADEGGRWLVGAAILLCLATMVQRFCAMAIRYALPRHTIEFVLRRPPLAVDPIEKAHAFVNRGAAEGDRVFLGVYARYWLRADLLQCVSTEHELDGVLVSGSAAEGWSYLFENGFRFVILSSSTHGVVVERLALQEFPEFASSAPEWLGVRRVMAEGSVAVYELRSHDSGRAPKVICRQLHPPAWDRVPR